MCVVHPGENQIRRRSDESSVTIPYDRTFRRIGSRDQPTGEEALSQFQFCKLNEKKFPLKQRKRKRISYFFRWLRLATTHVDTQRNGSWYKIRCIRYDQRL